LIGPWAILGTWQDEAARGPLLPSEPATIDLFEKTRVPAVDITTQAKVVHRWTRSVVNIPVLAGRRQHIGRFVRLTVLRAGRSADLSVRLPAARQEVRLGASLSKSAGSPSSVHDLDDPGKVQK